MQTITTSFIIWTIIIWIVFDVVVLFKGYIDGVKTQYTISYQIGKICKRYKFVEILFVFAIGVLVGHFLWHQCIV